MRRILLFCFFIFIYINLSAQSQSTSVNKIDLENSNSWALGGGFNNFIMHGDLRSIGTGNQGNFWNFGGYLYVDKMFNPLLGMEFKVNYYKISGAAQYFSDIYDILYVSDTQITDNLFFEGKAYGAEFSLIFSFSNLYSNFSEKWHFSGYFGAGYHLYDSALFQRNPDSSRQLLVDFGNNPARNNATAAASIYISMQLGLKYRINKRVDLEIRPSWYFNYEDHLDATISNKQDWETFFVTHLGISVKLGKKKTFTIWGDKETESKRRFQIVDTDGDGVMDQLDIEPNTPKGTLVYGNGKSVDSDKDTIPDHSDNCPLVPGSIENNGCPIDTDGDGLNDNIDLCPLKPGLHTNKGCPKAKKEMPKQQLFYNINVLSASIFFDTSKDVIRKKSYKTLDKIADIMEQLPEVNFVIEGHTDNRDRYNYNSYLSKRRAANVRRYLISKKISPNRLSFTGFGESRPKFSNETEEGRQLNRRVEIHPLNPNVENPDKHDVLINNKTHVVKKGETLFSIARKYKKTIQEIRLLNNLKNNIISIGQKLKINE